MQFKTRVIDPETQNPASPLVPIILDLAHILRVEAWRLDSVPCTCVILRPPGAFTSAIYHLPGSPADFLAAVCETAYEQGQDNGYRLGQAEMLTGLTKPRGTQQAPQGGTGNG